MTALAPARWTMDQFLALPDDPDLSRELIDGELVEGPMTYHDHKHGQLLATIAGLLMAWARSRPAPRPMVVGGDTGFRMREDPPLIVGLDVAITFPDQATDGAERGLLMGPPLLAVEIMSPSDTSRRTSRKVRSLRNAGTPMVWLVDPDLELITVFTDAGPVAYGAGQSLPGGPLLPGLTLRLGELFEG